MLVFAAIPLIAFSGLNSQASSLPVSVGDSNQIPSNALDLGQETSKIMDWVKNKNSSNASLSQKTEESYGQGMPGALILIRPHLHPWRIEPDRGGPPASVDDLISAARDRISENSGQAPVSSVDATLSTIDQMNSKERVSYDKLPSNELGLYYKVCGAHSGKKAGMIALNPTLAVIATEVGRPIVACVLFHEAGHASDPNICRESVSDVESFAFHREYDCIKAVYPTGEEIATTKKILDNAEKYRPSPLIKKSVDFMSNMYQIYRTGGKDRRIRALVRKLYKSDGTPKSSGA